MKNIDYSDQIANSINRLFKQMDLHYDFDKENGRFSYNVYVDCRLQSIRTVIHVYDEFFIVYAYCPIKADIRDEAMMNAVSEFINRANYGMCTGNFEFDFRDGEIRYKIYVNCEDGVMPSKELLGYNIFYCPYMRLETYADGLLNVMFGGMSAQEAVDKCEQQHLDALSNEESDNRSDVPASDTETTDADSNGAINLDLFGEGGNES